MVLKKRLKRLLIIAMVVVTAVWAVALFLHLQAYGRYIQKLIETAEARGIPHGTPHPILGWQFGGYLVISGIAIFIAWVMVLAIPIHANGQR